MRGLDAAIAERDAGIARAAASAERAHPRWCDMALAFLHRYARSHREFLAEDCTAAAVAWGLAMPSQQAFGGVYQRAARLGMITKIGYAPSKRRHLSPAPVWASNVFKGTPC
jgi:hypothetical protein